MQTAFARRVAILDPNGARLVFHANRSEAERIIERGLGVIQHSKEIRLTCHPVRGVGQSLPQYRDSGTYMLGKFHEPCKSFIRYR